MRKRITLHFMKSLKSMKVVLLHLGKTPMTISEKNSSVMVRVIDSWGCWTWVLIFWMSVISLQIFTSRKRSCKGYVFTGVCLSTRGGGLSASVHAGIPHPTLTGSRHPLQEADIPPKRQTPPREQTPPQEADTPPGADPPERRPLLWTVRILLEGILVLFNSSN